MRRDIITRSIDDRRLELRDARMSIELLERLDLDLRRRASGAEAPPVDSLTCWNGSRVLFGTGDKDIRRPGVAPPSDSPAKVFCGAGESDMRRLGTAPP